jgi:hypothetical protein
MKIIDIPRSGSQASTTSSRNRGGQYTRNRRSPVQPIGSGRRTIVRQHFATASKEWQKITDAQRAQWSAVADSFPYVDSLGQTIKLTGHQFFVACWSQLLNVGRTPSADAPPTTAVWGPYNVSAAASAAAGTLEVTFTGNGTAQDATAIACSPQVSPGVSYNNRYWQAFEHSGVDDTLDMGAAYIGEFGALVAGKKIFVRFTPISQYGVTGTPQVVSCIVGA